MTRHIPERDTFCLARLDVFELQEACKLEAPADPGLGVRFSGIGLSQHPHHGTPVWT